MDLGTIPSIIGTILGAFIAGIIGMITACYSISYEKEITKKNTARALCSEVKINQKLLQPLANLIEDFENAKKEGKITFQIPQRISFDRTVYSTLSSKIGLLNSDKVVNYYTQIKFTEYLYKQMNVWSIRLNSNSTAPGEIIECSKNAKETHSTGDNLIRDLKKLSSNNVLKSLLSRLTWKYK